NVPAITNVWQLTEPQYKGNIVFKSPDAEQVNMNFLVMLTSEEWSTKLAEAYKNYYEEEIDLGDYENAGYKWIAEFLENCVFGNSDTTLAEEISQETAQGKIGLFVLSKLRSSSVYTENLTVGQYAATEAGTAIEPFSGFMYPMYAMVSSNASRPYTAMAFIDYLMTADGFHPWGKSIGAYSTNTAIAPLEGDLGLDVWKDTLVMEDPEYILDNYEDVYSFVTMYLQ
ncbi:MAG: ABC transporter substrate-binding protein, partial [Clostridia bacterium]|nr:ABC transporter substrate-binding protein [Clostridia bacterium]